MNKRWHSVIKATLKEYFWQIKKRPKSTWGAIVKNPNILFSECHNTQFSMHPPHIFPFFVFSTTRQYLNDEISTLFSVHSKFRLIIEINFYGCISHKLGDLYILQNHNIPPRIQQPQSGLLGKRFSIRGLYPQ